MQRYSRIGKGSQRARVGLYLILEVPVKRDLPSFVEERLDRFLTRNRMEILSYEVVEFD